LQARFRLGQRAYSNLHFLTNPRSLDGHRDAFVRGKGNANEKDAMSMRRFIGISLACLVTSACAIDKTSAASTPRSPDDSSPQANGETPTNTPPLSAGGLRTDGASIRYGSEQSEQRCASLEPSTDACRLISDPCCGASRTIGITLFGRAAWYNLVGRQTASGEILDTVTATAAHRSLPLASYAKVTNLGNGHAVVVKINDRGPYTRGRILDLSPRAADALDMKRVGVATVVVEPLVHGAGPTVALFQTPGTAVSQ